MASDGLFYGNTDHLMTEQALHTATEKFRICSVEEYYDSSGTINWLRSSSLIVRKVALQFPDDMLTDSAAVVAKLRSGLPDMEFFILADTSYGSCCVDTVAAQHYNADVLVHYGPSCLSPTTGLPVYWVFGQAPVDVEHCASALCEVIGTDTDKKMVLMYSVEYHHKRNELHHSLVEKYPGLVLSTLVTEQCPPNEYDKLNSLKANGRIWKEESDKSQLSDYNVIYIGAEGRTLTNLMMVMNCSQFYSYNPVTKSARLETVQVNKSLMKRYYMVERAKDARIVGIVVGTMGVSNYLEEHERLKEIIRKAGKKSYSFVVGKLNPAKLGNFMEIDVFVLISCAENTLIDSSEFYKPVVTPYELEIACISDREWTGDYVTDFTSLLPGGSHYLPVPDEISPDTDISLISGGMRRVGLSEDDPKDSKSKSLVLREKNMSVMLSNSATTAGEYLSSRTWTGLEQDLGKTPVQKAKIGQTGIASHYQGEPGA